MNANPDGGPTVMRPGARRFFIRRYLMESLDWTALSSAFSAVCIALYGAYKAVVKLIAVLKRGK